MADITFTCPYCEQALEASDEILGLKVVCPACQCELQIPKVSEALRPLPPPVPNTSIAAIAPAASLQILAARPSNINHHFLAAKCPSCGGDLQVPDDREQVKCMYCGGTVIIRHAVQLASGVNLANLMELAKAAAKANNPKEAHDYYSRVLEYEPRNSEAWAGKGEAVGWMSTVGDIRTAEMVAAFENAIKFASASDRSVWLERRSEVTTFVAVACYSISRRHLERLVQVADSWPDYVRNCFRLRAALYNALSFYPSDKTALELLVRICTDLIRGVDYTSGFFPFFHVLRVSSECQSKLRTSLDEDSASLSLLDPGFVKPKI